MTMPQATVSKGITRAGAPGRFWLALTVAFWTVLVISLLAGCYSLTVS
jgi:hypothetical protein